VTGGINRLTGTAQIDDSTDKSVTSSH